MANNIYNALLRLKKETDTRIRIIHIKDYQMDSIERSDRVQHLTYTNLDLFGEAPWLLLALYRRQDLIDCIRKYEYKEGPGCFDWRFDDTPNKLYEQEFDELKLVMNLQEIRNKL